LIAKFYPTVRDFLNFLQRHVAKSAEPEKVNELKEITSSAADDLPASSACFKMGQEPFAFYCQRG